MKKKILISLALLLLSFGTYAQSRTKYKKAKKDQVQYISEAAYWKEFVKSTDGLYESVETVRKSADAIMVVTRFIPKKGKKVRQFYKRGKLIGEYVGREFINYGPPSRKTIKKNNEYRRQKDDRITYLSERDFSKKYLRKRTRSKRKIMVVSRRTKKNKRYLIFYKKGKMIGQFINGKYFPN